MAARRIRFTARAALACWAALAGAPVSRAVAQDVTPAAGPPPAAELLPNIGVGVRLGGTLQGSSVRNGRHTLEGFQLDTVYVEPRARGKLSSWLGWQASFNANAGSYGSSGAHVMDLIVQLDFHDAIHVWGGHLLVPSDRSNFSGPFFISPWNYPGLYGTGVFVGPSTGPYGRDTGAVAWGQFFGGKLKYYLGGFGLEGVTSRPKLASRVAFDIVGAEEGYFGSSTYYGRKKVVGIGGGLEYRKRGELGPAPPPTLTCTPGVAAGTLSCITDPAADAPLLGDLMIEMVDLLAEGRFGDAGVGTFESAYYHFDRHYPVKQGYFVLASYLTPWQLGVGKLQPLVRFQQAFNQTSGGQNVLDAFLGYIVRSYDLRFHLGYQRQNLGLGPAWNAVQIGMQLQQ